MSIVTYAATPQCACADAGRARERAIIAAIDGLTPAAAPPARRASTLAYQQARAGVIQGGINHVLLCTDGDFNVGPSSDGRAAGDRSRARTGVTLTALGFGIGNLNDDMMEAVSNAGNGIYGVITNPTQADRYAPSGCSRRWCTSPRT